uniref:Uncharacterized protein n=1 Tax=Oryza meridionalis TaxID=40149 RepID=A0A0E0FAR6_9ORYZ
MLPEGHGKLRGYVRFFNLFTAIVRVYLPLSSCGHRDTAVRLLHPFTGDITDFPPLDTLLPYPYTSRSEHLRDVTAASISLAHDLAIRHWWA